jgi:hypothetical protein
MSLADYQLFLCDPQSGVRYDILDDWSTIQYTLQTNIATGMTASIGFDGTNARIAAIRPDTRIEIWRRTAGGAWKLEGDTAFLVRRPRYTYSRSGGELQVLDCLSADFLISGRDVAYNAESSQAKKSGAADDALKALVRDNLGSSAIAARDLSAYLAVAADVGLGPSLTAMDVGWHKLDSAFSDIVKNASEQGTNLYWQIVALPTAANGHTFEFRTYTGYRGVDRSDPGTIGNPVRFGPQYGNVDNVDLEWDYTQEATVCYALGTGQGANLVTASYEDTVRSARSPFGRREVTRNARTSTDTLADVAKAGCNAGRPVRRVRADLIDTDGTSYGRDWQWGDVVVGTFRGETDTYRVEAVSVSVDKKKETVTARLDSTAQIVGGS